MKHLLVRVAFAGLVGASASASFAHGTEGHKNLTVIEDSDHKTFERGMKKLSSGLGVKCGGCHVKGKFALDDVPAKAAAREFLDVTVGETDKAKRGEALKRLLSEMKLARAKNEVEVWEAVDAWKKKSKPVAEDSHEGHH